MPSLFVLIAFTLSFMGTAHITQKQQPKYTPQAPSIEEEVFTNQEAFILDEIDNNIANAYLDQDIFDEYNVLNKKSKVKTICSDKTHKQYDKFYCEQLNTMFFCIKHGQSKESVEKTTNRINANKASKKDFKIISIDNICNDYFVNPYRTKGDFWSVSHYTKEILKNETTKRQVYELEKIITDIYNTPSDWSKK